jgi:hypothetical protein
MPFVPARPSALNHLSSAVASAVLAKHFGDMAAAARELGVERKHLQQLARHNPRILNAAHERMDLFRQGVKSKIIQAVLSKSAKRQRWGCDAMFDSYEFRDQVAEYAVFAPAPRQCVKAVPSDDGQSVLEQEAVAELAREQAIELDRDCRRELEGGAMVAEIEPLRKFGRAPQVQPSLWPAGIRRPSRGGWR